MDANIGTIFGTNIGTNVKYITRYIKERYVQKKIRRDLYERLVRWCGGDSVNVCLERALSVLESSAGATSAPNIGANIGTNATQATEMRRTGHVWCEKKARIRNLQGFLKWVEKTYGLVDYWEEEDRYCFETLEAPEKSKGRGERKRRSEEGEVEAEELE